MVDKSPMILRDDQGNEYISSSALWPVFQELFARYVKRPSKETLLQFGRVSPQTACELGIDAEDF